MKKTKVGVGYGNYENPFHLGKTVAENAMDAGQIDRPDLVLAFCHGDVNQEVFLTGLQSVVGTEVPVVGGSALGVITNHNLSYKNYPAGAAVLQADGMAFRVAAVGRLDKGENQAGARLAVKLKSRPDDRLLVVFYDSVRIPPTASSPPVLNTSSNLLAGMEAGLPPGRPVIGAGLIGDYVFHRTGQFCGSYAADQHAVGLVCEGNVRPFYRIMHGCTPLDGIYHRITRMKGDTIFEFDGKPAAEVIDGICGGTDWREQHPVGTLTVGVNLGERYGEPQEKQYINRLITGTTPDGKGLMIFEADLEEGMEIQFMLRDAELMHESARQNTEELIREISEAGLRPVFGLYIDCAGRTAEYSNTLTEEAAEIQKILTREDVPLLGFYSGVEIAPLMGKSRGLDWTGVLLILAEGA